VFDLGILYGVGALGYLMRCADIRLSSAIVGLILSPLADQQFRRAVAISQGDLTGRDGGPVPAAHHGALAAASRACCAGMTGSLSLVPP
jgi:putative tricarboxylic transport membrane protein